VYSKTFVLNLMIQRDAVVRYRRYSSEHWYSQGGPIKRAS